MKYKIMGEWWLGVVPAWPDFRSCPSAGVWHPSRSRVPSLHFARAGDLSHCRFTPLLAACGLAC